MSDTSARARRLAFWFGSLERNGLIGRRGVVAPPAGGAKADGAPAGGVAGTATGGATGGTTDWATGGATGGAGGGTIVAGGTIGVAYPGDSGGAVARAGATSGAVAIDGVAVDRVDVAGGTEGAPSAGVTGVARRADVNGGTRPRVPNDDPLVVAPAPTSGLGSVAPPRGTSALTTKALAPGALAAEALGAEALAAEALNAEALATGALAAIVGDDSRDEARDEAIGAGRLAAEGTRVVDVGKSSAHRTLPPTGINPAQMEHRARRFALVTFAGSTRKTEWHSGHETFMTRQSR